MNRPARDRIMSLENDIARIGTLMPPVDSRFISGVNSPRSSKSSKQKTAKFLSDKKPKQKVELSLNDALEQLFTFIEIESNIDFSLVNNPSGKYAVLKKRLRELASQKQTPEKPMKENQPRAFGTMKPEVKPKQRRWVSVLRRRKAKEGE